MDLDADAPLDFEVEDKLLTPVCITKKRKNQHVTTLDELLQEKIKSTKVVEEESKRAKKKKEDYNSDEDDDMLELNKAAQVNQIIGEVNQQLEDVGGDDDCCSWGIPVFGSQKTPPLLDLPEFGSCLLLQTFMKNELNSLVEINAENGETFLQGLLMNGWLLKLIYNSGHVENVIARWTFNLMLYSVEEELRTSACDFWCAILSSKNEVDLWQVKIDWFPRYSDLKRALEIYGFLLDPANNSLSNSELVNIGSDCGGPPQNVRAWIKYIAACCQVRSIHSIFSISEVEELLGVIIHLFLERLLEGLSTIIQDCMLSIVSFFTDKEWDDSCEKVAKVVACRVPRDLNCLRIVQCILGVNTRSKHLKSAIAFEFLKICFDNKAGDAEEMLKLLVERSKDKNRDDYFNMFICLVLTENWLLTSTLLQDKPVIYRRWSVYIRNSSQIKHKDLRHYAWKVRHRASYLVQGTVNR